MSTFAIWNEACQKYEYICLHDTDGECNGWLRWVEVPLTPESLGEEGDVARDDSYFYVYNSDINMWGRTAISYNWNNATTTEEITTTIEII
jgi:hypothetical protein